MAELSQQESFDWSCLCFFVLVTLFDQLWTYVVLTIGWASKTKSKTAQRKEQNQEILFAVFCYSVASRFLKLVSVNGKWRQEIKGDFWISILALVFNLTELT